MATSAEEEVHIQKHRFLKVIGKYSHTPQSICTASIMDIETENWKTLSLLTFYHLSVCLNYHLPLTADREAEGQRPLSLWRGPRWDLCCKKQGLPDVALSWNDVTPALWYTHVTQMSAGLKFSCPLWVHSLCNFQPSSQFQWGFLKVRHFTRSP